jgi:hypothetical protein
VTEINFKTSNGTIINENGQINYFGDKPFVFNVNNVQYSRQQSRRNREINRRLQIINRKIIMRIKIRKRRNVTRTNIIMVKVIITQ